MREIDLHGLKTAEALEYFVRVYNDLVRSKSESSIRVIHGYGSSGAGGDTKRAFRSLLRGYPTHASYVCGEDIDGNPGYTIVYPKHRLPVKAERLWDSIVEFCDTPRTQAEIIRKFVRKAGETELLKALRELASRRKLRSFYKDGRKHFVAIDSPRQ